MRVLQIGMSKGYGGVESFVMTYFRSLKDSGIFFDFVDIYGDGLAYSDEILALGGRIYTLNNYKKHPIAARRQLKRILSENGYDCVHIHMLSAANLIPLTVCLQAGIIPVVHSHNNDTVGILKKVLHAINRPFLRNSKAVKLACGEEAGGWMYGGKNFTVVPNAISVDKFRYREEKRREYREKCGAGEETLILGFVGRLEFQKNPLFLIEILAALKEKGREDCKLLIIGEGSMEAQMRQKAEMLGVADQVIFAGRQLDVGNWLPAMDVFLLPSHFEGLCICAVEAQCAGLPALFAEGVPRETALTDLPVFLPTDKGPEIWVQVIDKQKLSTAKRESYAVRMENSPYSITASSKMLKEIYLRAAQGSQQ